MHITETGTEKKKMRNETHLTKGRSDVRLIKEAKKKRLEIV